MDIEIKMPQLGATSNEVRIIKWLVKEGQEVKKGEPLCEVETDKATMELESFESGTILKINFESDTFVNTGTVVAVIGSADEVIEKNVVKTKKTEVKAQGKPNISAAEILFKIGSKKALEMFEKMLEIRLFEERVRFLFLEGKMPGTVHQYIGMEACAVGVCSALEQDDVIASTHRPHGHAIARGLTMDEIMAELYGKTTGCCKGKGGSMHVGDIAKGMLPAIAIVGGNIPVIVGIALSFKLRKQSRVAVSFFGDGASNEGAFHESLNMASVYNLPALFVCENNKYSASTAIEKVMKVANVADRACAYGMREDIGDGMNVLDVYNRAKEALDLARNNGVPTLLELKTFRLCGHSRRDTNNYMTKEEIQYWKGRDPIIFYETLLIKEGLLDSDKSIKIRKLIDEKIEMAIKFSQSSPDPKPEDTYNDLYVTMEVPR